MKASFNWLRELCPVDADVGTVAAACTAAGLEVEGIASLGDFAGVVVAEVRGRKPHPRADKLTLVEVFDGRAVADVVCGAPNVPAPGGKVAWARPGARLPLPGGGQRVLEAREVRGIASPGMLCAEDELGLGDSHAGIIELDAAATAGDDVAALLGLPDAILELNVTPNRPDWMGHLGIAREVAALFSTARAPLPLRWPSAELAPFAVDEPAAPNLVEIRDPEGCARYVGRMLVGVSVRESPLAVRMRLQALGMRAINAVVDATNLVLLETGQPLHAFDLHRLEGLRVVVRRARDGETIRTLDGQERALCPDDVAICDAARPVAIAGVMGGAESEVGPATTAILLESAWFEPAHIRRTSRRLGLRSEASQRFERGVDPNEGVAFASARCARLIAEQARAPGVTRIAGAGAVDRYPRRIDPARVTLRTRRTFQVLGMDVPAAEQLELLGRLGVVAAGGVAGAQVELEVPTFRPDLTREIDLIEEVGRLVGLERVPATLPPLRPRPGEGPDTRPEAARDVMVALGFTEHIGFSFGPADDNPPLGALDDRSTPLRLQNPLGEDRASLRLSLVPGLLRAGARNLARGVSELRLFEVGTVFLPREGRPIEAREGWPARGRDEVLPEERRRVAGLLLGRRAAWLKDGGAYDFFDGKGVVEALLGGLRIASARYRPLEAGASSWLHPGRSAALSVASQVAGVVGELHPDARKRLEGETRVDLGGVILFEVDLGRLGEAVEARAVESPRFPAAGRDLSFFIARAVPAAELAEVMAAASPLVESVRILDDYREPGRVPADQKGMLFALSYRAADHTLTDEEVARAHASVVEAVASRFTIERR